MDGEKYIGYIFTRRNDNMNYNFYDLLEVNYLNDSNIEFIIERISNKDRIISIGLVKFNNNTYINDIEFYYDVRYKYNIISLSTTSNIDKLYLCNEVIENIERAIEIKYKSYKFVEKFELNGRERNVEIREML